jgi:hypothetical protein
MFPRKNPPVKLDVSWAEKKEEKSVNYYVYGTTS